MIQFETTNKGLCLFFKVWLSLYFQDGGRDSLASNPFYIKTVQIHNVFFRVLNGLFSFPSRVHFLITC